MKRALLFIILILFPLFSKATHLRGGEITYKVIDTQTRTIKATLTLYVDTNPGSVDQPDADLSFGDGTPCVNSKIITRTRIGAYTDVLTFEYLHSYVTDGNYVISFNEENRNEFINNIADGNSVNISFYIESKIIIHAKLTNNSSFQYDRQLKYAFHINEKSSLTLTGSDTDGDSLAFELLTPQFFEIKGSGCVGAALDVPKYFLPDSTILNKYSGNLQFYLTKVGLYSFAIKVSEFKSGQFVGYTIRDFQIEANYSKQIFTFDRVSENDIKEFDIIDLKIGQPLNLEFSLTGDSPSTTILTAYSELLELKKAHFEATEVDSKKVIGRFSFLFDSSSVRNQPYIVTVRAETNGFNRLYFGSKDLTFILNPKLKPFIDTTKTVPIPPDPTTDTPTAITKKIEGPRILASPNPTAGGFYLNTSAFPQSEIFIYNSAGKIISKQFLSTSARVEVKRNELSPGVYFFLLRFNGMVKGWGKVVFE